MGRLYGDVPEQERQDVTEPSARSGSSTTICRVFLNSKLAAAQVVGWSSLGRLLQSSWDLPTHVTTLAMDL